MSCSNCNTGDCSCGQLTINPGKKGDPGTGIVSVTGVAGTDGTVEVTVLLTNNNVQTFTIPAGTPGVSVDHVSITTSTLDASRPPQAGLPGATDVYSIWSDAEEIPENLIGTFSVYNGTDGNAEVQLTNLGEGEAVYVEGSTFDLKTITSSTLGLSSSTEELNIEDSTYPVYIEIPTNQIAAFPISLGNYDDYQKIEVTNRANKVIPLSVTNTHSFEWHPQLTTDTSVLDILPGATVVLWKSDKQGTPKVTILSYNSFNYEIEQDNFLNGFNFSTERVYSRKTLLNEVNLSGRIKWQGTSVNNNGACMTLTSKFRPTRNIYFSGVGVLGGGSLSTVDSLNRQTKFTVYFTLQPSGTLSITGIDAPLLDALPVTFDAGDDIQFIKTYISNISFSTNYIAGYTQQTQPTE